MIEGVQVKWLVINTDERGFLTELLRSDDEIFERFAQCYMTLSYPGVIRAWHAHKYRSDLICVAKGMIKLVLYDPREGSSTQGNVEEFFLGDQSPMMVRVPANVIHGYQIIGVEPALLLNFSSELYDREAPDELRFPWDANDVPYNWLKQGKGVG